MSKPKLIITTLLSLGLVTGLGISFYLIYSPPKEATPASAYNEKYQPRGRKTSQPAASNGLSSQGTVSYADEAGFTFMHNLDVQVVDVTPEDTEHYSKLILKKGTGQMTVTIKDTNYSSIDSWYESEGHARSLVGAVSLDDIEAKQYADNSHLFTVAVDGGVLYTIQSTRDTSFWDVAHDTFISTFAFDIAESTPVQVSTSNQAGGVIYEEEEVIE